MNKVIILFCIFWSAFLFTADKKETFKDFLLLGTFKTAVYSPTLMSSFYLSKRLCRNFSTTGCLVAGAVLFGIKKANDFYIFAGQQKPSLKQRSLFYNFFINDNQKHK